MSPQITMPFEVEHVESALCADFQRAAECEHKPPAQVLRELMQHYVQQVHGATPAISPDERKQREAAVRYARASVGLEGFDVPDAYQQELERFVQGDIDFPALTAKTQAIARHLTHADSQ